MWDGCTVLFLMMASGFLVRTGQASVCSVPPPYLCTCREAFEGSGLHQIDCTGQGLAEVPDFSIYRGLPVWGIDLSWNQISVIPNAAFEGLRFVKYEDEGGRHTPRIDFHINNINRIEDRAFVNFQADALQLSLTSVQLDEIPVRALSHIDNLTDLRLNDNRITSIPANAFTSLKKLRFLSLDGNPITNLNSYAFKGLENNLHYLHLSNMRMKSFPTEALRSLRVLQTVSLSGNNLGDLNSPMFSGFVDRRISLALELRDADIRSLNASALAKSGVHLNSLDLTTNELTNIDFLSSPCDLALQNSATVIVSGNAIVCDCKTLEIWRRLPEMMSKSGDCAGPTPFVEQRLEVLTDDGTDELMQQTCPDLFHNGKFIHDTFYCISGSPPSAVPGLLIWISLVALAAKGL